MATLRQVFSDIAGAIRSKGITGTFKPIDMASKIGEIQSGGSEPTNPRAVFAYGTDTRIIVPQIMVVDTIAVTNLKYCFTNCSKLTTLTLPAGFGQNATDISYCFSGCSVLKSLMLPDGFGQYATTLRNCFTNCSKLTTLTLPAGFGQNATDIQYCFSNFPSTPLTLPAGFGQKATNTSGCFYGASLTSLSFPEGFGQNATDISYLFNNCTSLTSLSFPEGFGQKATNTTNCFKNCTSLTNITGNPSFKKSVSLSNSTKLTHDSIMVVINGLQTVTTTQTLTLGSTNLAKLTEADKKIATDKGWTLA